MDCNGGDVTQIHRVAEGGGHPVVAKPTRVDWVRYEILAEGVHLQQRGHACEIPEVVAVLALCQRGTSGRFGSNHLRVRIATDDIFEERERQAR